MKLFVTFNNINLLLSKVSDGVTGLGDILKEIDND